MGSSAYEQMEEGREQTLLARELGLTIDELGQTEWESIENASDDGLIYGYSIYISPETPAHIRKKIRGLGDAEFVTVGPNAFDKDYDDSEPE